MSILNSGLAKSLAEDYTIDNSCRFNDPSEPTLKRTPASAGSARIHTVSLWLKRGNIDQCTIFAAWKTPITPDTKISGVINSDDRLEVGTGGGTGYYRLRTTQLFRDPSAWYHIVMAWDTNQATDTDRLKIYVNGTHVTDFYTEDYPARYFDNDGAADGEFTVGATNSGSAYQHWFDGYIAEFYFIDGTQYDADDFGELDSDTNQWIPKDAVDDLTFGTNGFYQKYGGTEDADVFADSSSSDHTITSSDVVHSRGTSKFGDSSIFFNGSDAYLSIPDSADWDFFANTSDSRTIDLWVNQSTIAHNKIYFFQRVTSSDYWYFGMAPTENAKIYGKSGGAQFISSNAASFDATGVWHHLALVKVANEVAIYVDGAQITYTTFSTTQTLAAPLIIGSQDGTSDFFHGYMEDVRFSDSNRFSATPVVGLSDTITIPTAAAVADSNTTLLVQSDWDGGLGADSSGNYNTFTPTNLVATDQMIDTPTNNFSTMNPISTQVLPLSEGNLWASTSAAESASNTIGMESGKWYFEVLPDSTSFTVGIINNTEQRIAAGGSGTVIAIDGGADVNTPNSTEDSDTFTSAGSGDIYGFALDVDAKTVDFYQNNTKVVEASSFTIDPPYFLAVDRDSGITVTQKMNFGADSSFAGTVTAQGNQDGNGVGDFYYTPPTDYLALCTSNLPDPEIALPGDNFNTILYDDGAGAKTGVGFQPDLVWVKSRGSGYDHKLTDSVRGVTKALVSNDDTAETTDSTGLTVFGSDGFTVGADTDYCDTTGTGMVAWSWKAGGAPTVDNSAGVGVTPTAGSVKIDGSNLGSALAGSIAATRISANTTSGFSIVLFTNNNTSGATIAHGLSSAPEMVITKLKDAAYSWYTYHVGLDATAPEDYCVWLNHGTARSDNVQYWNDAAPSASVFTLGDEASNSLGGEPVIAYCFHSVEGYSKMGTYTGNGVADGGPFVYTGFRPRFAMVKRTDSTGAWPMWDIERPGYNMTNDVLYVGSDDAETTGAGTTSSVVDLVSNGFKLMGTSGNSGEDGGTFIYYAVAQNPFKYSNAR